MSTTDSAFDDADELGQYLTDTKGSDKRRVTSIADARGIVEQFGAGTSGGAWPSLDRQVVATRLLDLLGPDENSQPEGADLAGAAVLQGAMNLCGPAAFFRVIIKRDPVMFAAYATQLFENGAARIGGLEVTPSQSIVEATYSSYVPSMGGDVCPQADWMVLGALRNSSNSFLTGTFTGDPDEKIAAATTPGTLASWLEQAGIYASVSNEANWMQPAGIPHGQGLSLAEGVDAIALINTDLMSHDVAPPPPCSWPMTEFPNHWVIVVGEVVQDVQQGFVYFNIWTWGQQHIMQVPQSAFVDNYYGAIIATLS